MSKVDNVLSGSDCIKDLTIKEISNPKTSTKQLTTENKSTEESNEEMNCCVRQKSTTTCAEVLVANDSKPNLTLNVESILNSTQCLSASSLLLRPDIDINGKSESFCSQRNEYKSIPITYFDPLNKNIDSDNNELLAIDENHCNDIVFALKQEIDGLKHEFIKTLKETEERFGDYLQEKEYKFFNAFKSVEERIDEKIDSIASDVKAVKKSIEQIESEAKKCYFEFENRFEMLRNDNEANQQSFQDCVTTLCDIESSLKENQFNEWSKRSTKQILKSFSCEELKSICEPITNKLVQEMHSIIENSFDDFKKTIIDQKIVQINGDQRHNACDQPIMFGLKLNKNIDQIKSEVLEMLNKGLIKECFENALNLADPQFVSHLCTAFKNNPEKLVSELEKCRDSQTIFISLLDQLFSDGVISKRWKIRLIEMLMIRIDLDLKISRDSVPKLAKHWSAAMEQIYAMGGDFSQEAKLLAISFKFLSQDIHN